MILAIFLILCGGMVAAGLGLTWLAILAVAALFLVCIGEGRVIHRQHQNERIERRVRLRESAWHATERYR